MAVLIIIGVFQVGLLCAVRISVEQLHIDLARLDGVLGVFESERRAIDALVEAAMPHRCADTEVR